LIRQDLTGIAAFTIVGYTVFSVRTKCLNPRAAIAVPSHICAFQKHSLSDRDNIVVIINDSNKTICLVSAYLDIKFNNPVVGQLLQNTAIKAERSGWDLLVGSDSNSHSLLWGSETPNTRGNQVEEFLATHDLVIKNIGKEFTFVNTMGHKTIIDITFTSRSLDENIANWAVNTSESLSDHKRIEFNLDFDCSRTIESRNYNKANWGLFDSIIVRKTELLDPKIKWDRPRLDLEAEKLEKTIKYALNKTLLNLGSINQEDLIGFSLKLKD
jgi:ribosome-associated toxin RatA of RatAB toxin-antitoxin module